jgi:type I restriction enzyme S subunit
VSPHARVSLGDLLTLERRPVRVEQDQQYQEIGVYCFGRGIFHKTPRSGLEVGEKDLFLIKEGDFIIQVTFAWEGAVALASSVEDGKYGSVRFPTFRVDERRCDPHYLLNYFRTDQGKEQLVRICPGSAGRNRVLSIKRLPEVMVPLPPLPEQRRIVAKIDQFAAKIAEARGLRSAGLDEIELLLRITRAHVESCLSSKMPMYALADVIKSHDSGWSPQCEDIPAAPGEWGVLKTTSVQWKGFDPAQNKALRPGMQPRPELCVQPGDVLITRAGPVNRVGVACAVDAEYPRFMLSDKIVRVRPKASLLPHYLSIALSMPSSQERFRQGKTGLAESQVNISREKLLALRLAVPTLDEQRRIVTYLDDLQAKVDRLKELQAATAAELNALLPSILDRAFKGEL